MKYFRKQLLFLIGLGFLTTLHAQQVVTTAGMGGVRIGNLTVSWTVGELMTSTYTTQSFKLTQGVQQPVIAVQNVSSSSEMNAYKITAYPNPATDAVIVSIAEADEQQFTLRIFDVSGKLIHTVQITESETRILVANFPSGIYLLHISDGKNNVQTFKIIKN